MSIWSAGSFRSGWGKSPAARRTLDLTSESRRILAARMLGNSPWIFPSARNPGQHIARLNNAHDNLCKAAKKAGIDFNFVLYDSATRSQREWLRRVLTWQPWQPS